MENVKTAVYIQVVVNKLGTVNTTTETFDAELTINSRWLNDGDKIPDSWSPELYMENAIGEPSVKTETSAISDETAAMFHVEKRRMRGTFSQPMNLVYFPFDVQELSLQVKANHKVSEVDLLEDPKHMHKMHIRSFVDKGGFMAYRHAVTTHPNQEKDSFHHKEHQPLIQVSFFVARRPQFFIWNLYFIMLLLGCMSFLSFAMNVDKFLAVRMQLLFVLILSSVIFKNAMFAHVPRISYLTYIDKFVLVSILFIATMTFWHGITTRFLLAYRIKKDYIAASVFASIYIAYLLVAIFLIIIRPMKYRKQMEEKSNTYMKSERLLQEKKDDHLLNKSYNNNDAI